MYEIQVSLPERWHLGPVMRDECSWRALTMEGRPSDGKAKLAECLPYNSSMPVDGVGSPKNYHAYRKFRIGDGVFELGMWSSGDEVFSGVMQLDRIARGSAVETLILDNFRMTASQLNELVHALLRAKLRRLDPSRLNNLQRSTFMARCSEWDMPARDAVDLDIWHGLNLTFPLENPHPLPSTWVNGGPSRASNGTALSKRKPQNQFAPNQTHTDPEPAP